MIRTTAQAMIIASDLLAELKRLNAAGALFESDLEHALRTAREIHPKLPDDSGDRLVVVLTNWLHEHRRSQMFRPGAAAALDAARRVIDDASGKGSDGGER